LQNEARGEWRCRRLAAPKLSGIGNEEVRAIRQVFDDLTRWVLFAILIVFVYLDEEVEGVYLRPLFVVTVRGRRGWLSNGHDYDLNDEICRPRLGSQSAIFTSTLIE
jgi:hypothetical protein